MQTWDTIWNSRVHEVKKLPIEELLTLNGYDQAQSRLTPETIKNACDFYAEKMGLQPNESIFEVGCGAGAFLHRFKEKGHLVGGIDLSESLADIARVSIGGEFSSAAANELTCAGRWDHVMAFGLFMYFPDYDYAGDVLIRMLIKSTKSVTIMDIPDAAKFEECESRRRELIGPSYDDKYKDLKHLYYSKEWWITIAESLGLRYEIYDQAIPGYENSAFRYNVTILL